jgi:hypothetical protein
MGSENIATLITLGSGQTAAQAIEAIYQSALRRGADATGLSFFEAQFDSGTTLNSIRDTLVSSAEATSFVDPIVRLYEVAFGRQADDTGLTNWVASLRGGASLESITASFADSQEFTNRFGTTTDRSAFVESLYVNGLGRASDEAGKANWVASTLTSGQLLLSFSESAESVARLDSATTSFLANLVDGVATDTSASLTAITETVTVLTINTGRVVDGPLAGATIFIDTNGNGVLDDGEVSTISDATGGFQLTGGTGSLVSIGGTDISTGLAFSGSLSAPAGSTVLSPLTTLITQIAAQSGTSAADAEATVKAALGLDSSIDLANFDPFATISSSSATDAAKETALLVQAAAAKIANLVVQTAAVSSAATGSTTAAGITDAFASLATTLAAAGSGTTVDLTDATTIAGIISTALQTSATTQGITLDSAAVSTFASSTSTVTAANNLQVDTAVSGGGTVLARLTTTIQVQIVAQSSAADAIGAATTSGDFTAATADFTGDSLTTAISSTTVTDADGDGVDDSTITTTTTTTTTTTVTLITATVSSSTTITLSGTSNGAIVVDLTQAGSAAVTDGGSAVTLDESSFSYTQGTTDIVNVGTATLSANFSVTGIAANNDTVNIAGNTITGTFALDSGTDVLIATTGANITGINSGSATTAESLTLTGAVTMTAAQNNAFSGTITAGGGSDQITISDTANANVLANIETYVLASGGALTVTASQEAVNVTGQSGNETVTVAGLTVTGTYALGSGTDILIATNGADIKGINSGGATTAETLTLTGSATMTVAQHNAFTTFTASGGSDTIVLSNVGTITGKSGIESYTLANGTNTMTLSAAQTGTVAGGTGADAFTSTIAIMTAITSLNGAGNTGDSLTMSDAGTVTVVAAVTNIETLVLANGTNTVALNAAGAFTAITGGTGADSVALTNLVVGGAVSLGAGADNITAATEALIEGASSTFVGGADADTLTFAATQTYANLVLTSVSQFETLDLGVVGGASTVTSFASGVTTLIGSTATADIVINMTAAQLEALTTITSASALNSFSIVTSDGGGITVNLADTTFTTLANVDLINVSASSGATVTIDEDLAVTFGAGADTLNITGAITATSTIVLAGSADTVNVSVADGIVTATDIASSTTNNILNISADVTTAALNIGTNMDIFVTVNFTVNQVSGGNVITINNAATTVTAVGGDFLLGTGGDTFTASGSNVNVVTGGTGNDIITGGSGADTLDGGAGDDKFVYSTAAALFSGTALVDTITGNTGSADTIAIDSTGGAFTIDNTVTFAEATTVESITANAASANVYSITLNDNVAARGIVTVDLSADTNATGANVIDVSAETATAYTLTGSAGVDTITGGTGGDTIVGSTGADVLAGGGGNDTFNYTATLAEGLSGAGGSITGNAGTNILNITSATTGLVDADFANISLVQTLTLTGANTIVLGSNADSTGIVTITAGAGATNITAAGTKALNATAMAEANTLTLAGAADFTITGLQSDITGGSSTGTLAITLVADVTDNALAIVTGTGNVTVSGGGASGDTITVTGLATASQTFSAAGSGAVFNITGGANAQTITGSAQADTIVGGAGADTIASGGGGDTITGGAAADAMTGGTGVDTFTWTGTASAAIATETGATAGTDNDFSLGTIGDRVSSFTSASDKLNFAGALVTNAVGTETDTLLTIAAAGTVTNTARYVEITTSQSDGTMGVAITLLDGLTTTAVAVGDSFIAFIHDGTNGYLYLIEEAGTTDTISASEVTLIGQIALVTDVANGDFASF